MITTSPVTMRLNTKVLNAIKSEAKKAGTGYQTYINTWLAKSVGMVIIPVLTRAKPVKVKVKPLVVAKPKKAAKGKAKAKKSKSKKK